MKNFTTKLYSFLILIFILISNSAFSQSLTIVPDLAMDESNLDLRVLTLTITSETFADATLIQGNFTLNNVPAGTTIESITYTNPNNADLALAFDGTDFDSDSINVTVTVAGVELAGGNPLTSDSLTITAIVEPAILTITPDIAMDESNLDLRVLTLTLTNDTFVDATLVQGNFTLNNVPAGTTIESITYTNPNNADLALAFDGTDFDSDSINVTVTIAGAELAGGNPLTSDSLTITAIVEPAILTITPDLAMDESNLDLRFITLTLTNETFVDAALDPMSFTLNNVPTGTTIESITYTGTNNADIALAFDGTDFDSDSINVTISVLGVEFTGGNPLTSDSLTITAIVEPAILTITPDIAMDESNLDLRVLTLTITNDTFVDATLVQGNFTLNNVPAGTTIESITYTNSNNAELALAFDGTDFDADSVNVTVTIAGAELAGASPLTSDSLTIVAVLEIPTLLIIEDSVLIEPTLNYRTISMILSYDTYADNLFDNLNFTLNNAPAGITVDTLIYNSINNITMGLAFDDTDFDIDSTHFSITIAGTELASGLDITSNETTIFAVFEVPAITITSDTVMTEDNLDNRYVNVLVYLDQFADATLDQANFTLNNVPAGTTIESVVYTDSLNAVVNLAFDGTDFDLDSTHFSITIDSAEFAGGTNLVSNELTIIANPETPMLTATADTILQEDILDNRVLLLQLTYETFADNILDSANFTLNNAPLGVGVDSVIYIDTVSANLYMAFDGTDFDFDSVNVNVNVLSTELSSATDISSSAFTIYAIYEELNAGLQDAADSITLSMPDSVTIEFTNYADVDIAIHYPDSFSTYIPIDYLFDMKFDFDYSMVLGDSIMIKYEGTVIDTFIAAGGETEMWLSNMLGTARTVLINDTDATWGLSIGVLAEGEYTLNAKAYTALAANFDDANNRILLEEDSTIITVFQNIFISNQPQDLTMCTNYASTFTTSGVSSVAVKYQWRFNGVDIVDPADSTYAKDSILVINSTQVADAGDYSCYIYNNFYNVITDTVTLTVLVSPNVDLIDNYYLDTNQVIIIGATPGYDSYLWNTGETIPTIVVEANLLSEGTYNYWVSVVDSSNACVTLDSTLIHINFSSINVDELAGYQFSIYPNPANNILNIIYSGIDNSELNIQIIDITGKIIFNNRFEIIAGKLNKTISLSDISNGVYIIKATTNNKQFIDKLIVK